MLCYFSASLVNIHGTLFTPNSVMIIVILDQIYMFVYLRHDIAEILLRFALGINQSIYI